MRETKVTKRRVVFPQKIERIIPLLIESTEIDATTLISSGLSSVQFIDFTNCIDEIKYQKKAAQLLKTLNQDNYYYEQHKILLVKALKWLRQNRNSSILLRGYNLKKAEAWLKLAKQRTEHPPLPLHEEFITESTKQPPESALDVFISYSRVDSDFARKLNDALQLQGKTTWFDQESIASGVDFQQEINRGIETANNFLFIISPSSVHSPYCASEVEYAAKLNKRVVTVLYRGVSSQELHPILAGVQWIEFKRHGGDFYANFGELIRTLDTDTEHVRMHTRLLARALEWERQGYDDSFLLRGKDLDVSQVGLLQSADKEPKPNALQLEYLKASRELPFRNIKRRSVVLTSAMVTVLVVVARFFGGMESAELRVYDHLMRLRPSEPQDERFLIVEVDAASSEVLRQDMIEGRYQPGIGTIPDKALDEVLAKLSAHQPRLIGLDFYRDFQTQPQLAARFRQTQNLIALCKASFGDGRGNSPPSEVPMERIGFNDFSQDGEDFVRRHLLLQKPDPTFCNTREAFSLVLARKYLESQGISYTSPINNEGNYGRDMQFGKTAIPQLLGNGSPYQDTGDKLKGYQTLLNYRAYQGDPNNFAPTVSLEDVLKGNVSAKKIQDRIVIIGYTDAADRNADHWHTPYGDIPGVILQAQMASQMISAVAQAQSVGERFLNLFSRDRKQGRPSGRPRGGAIRDESCAPLGSKPLTALVPENEPGTTVAAHPTFWFYLPVGRSERVTQAEFTLRDENQRPVLKQTFKMALPDAPGIVSVKLPETERPLAVGKQYKWFFQVLCDQRERSRNLRVSGEVKRVEASPELVRQLKTLPESQQYRAFVEQDISQEALTQLALHRSIYSDDWMKLLKYFELEDVADAAIAGVLGEMVFSRVKL